MGGEISFFQMTSVAILSELKPDDEIWVCISRPELTKALSEQKDVP